MLKQLLYLEIADDKYDAEVLKVKFVTGIPKVSFPIVLPIQAKHIAELKINLCLGVLGLDTLSFFMYSFARLGILVQDLECKSGAEEFKMCTSKEVFLNCPSALWNDSSECQELKEKTTKCTKMPVMLGMKPPHHH